MKSILIHFIEVNKSIFKEVLFILLRKNINIAYHKIAYFFTNKIEKIQTKYGGGYQQTGLWMLVFW